MTQKMPKEYDGWKLVKEYKHFGLYTNGKWNTCFQKFDVGLIEPRKLRGGIKKYERIADTDGRDSGHRYIRASGIHSGTILGLLRSNTFRGNI